MNIAKYIPKTLIVSGVALYATVAACGAPESTIQGTDPIRSTIESIMSNTKPHIINLDPPLELKGICTTSRTSIYQVENNLFETIIKYRPDPDPALPSAEGSKFMDAILIWPEDAGKDIESDIESIARSCEN